MAQDIVILGAGGHAKVLVDVARAAGSTPRRCIARAGDLVSGVPVAVGDDAELMNAMPQNVGFVVGVGDMTLRRRLSDLIDIDGRAAQALVHPSSVIGASVDIAPGACVMAGSIINADAQIGRHAVINSGAVVEHDVVVADGAFIGPGAVLTGDVSIGPNAMVGARAVVNPGVRIGAGTIVGAGAVVVEDVDEGACVAGAPARPLRAA